MGLALDVAITVIRLIIPARIVRDLIVAEVTEALDLTEVLNLTEALNLTGVLDQAIVVGVTKTFRVIGF